MIVFYKCYLFLTCNTAYDYILKVFVFSLSSVQGGRELNPHVSGLGWPVKAPISLVLWCDRSTSSS